MRDQTRRKEDLMIKLLLGAALGFAAAWLLDSKEGEQRRALVKDKATGYAGKGKEQALKGKEQALGKVGQVKEKASSAKPGSGADGGSFESPTSAEPIAPREPTSTPGSEASKES
jgi:hypothetical protein